MHKKSDKTLSAFALRQFRTNVLGMNQMEFAEALGYGIATIRKYENFSREITHHKAIGYALAAIHADISVREMKSITLAELRQKRIDHINRKISKSGLSDTGILKPVSQRSASNALPGTATNEFGDVVICDNDQLTVDPMDFKAWRKSHRFTLNDIARKFNVSPTTTKKWAIYERAMGSPRLWSLACSAINAGLSPVFDDRHMITRKEIFSLGEEYRTLFSNSKKKGQVALNAFYRQHQDQSLFLELNPLKAKEPEKSPIIKEVPVTVVEMVDVSNSNTKTRISNTLLARIHSALNQSQLKTSDDNLQALIDDLDDEIRSEYGTTTDQPSPKL